MVDGGVEIVDYSGRRVEVETQVEENLQRFKVPRSGRVHLRVKDFFSLSLSIHPPTNQNLYPLCPHGTVAQPMETTSHKLFDPLERFSQQRCVS